MKPVKVKEIQLGTLKADQYFFSTDLDQYGQVIQAGAGSVRVRLWGPGAKAGTTRQYIVTLAYATPVVWVAERPSTIPRQ